GPEEVFEGNKGFKDSVSGPFEIDWSKEDLESVKRTIIKKHNAEIHSQSALDAALDIRAQEGFKAEDIDKIRLTTFDVAYSIIGGGEEGDKQLIRTKEEADHSLPWMLAVVLLDGQLNPEQYEPARIVADDVQALIKKVEITPSDEFFDRFPDHMPAELEVTLNDGSVFTASQDSYLGFHDNPLDWENARKKFDALVTPFTGEELREEIATVIHELDTRQGSDLTAAVAKVSPTRSQRKELIMSNAVPHNVSFNFVPRAYRPEKPRTFGMTEIRAPYYSTFGTRHLQDVFDVAGQWVDGIKWAGGSFALVPTEQVRAFSDIAHENNAYVSSGGWIETVLRYGDDAVDHYLKEAKEVGFDVIEISTGFIMLNTSGLQRLVEKVVKAGLKAKPELGLQIGSGGDSGEAELAAEGKKDIGDLVDRGKKALDAGASIIMIESEGITENVTEWDTGAAASIINGLGLENVMFEAADGPVFEWYVKNYGNECNLFVDHSQILQLEGLRQNIWGNKSTWGRVINPAP